MRDGPVNDDGNFETNLMRKKIASVTKKAEEALVNTLQTSFGVAADRVEVVPYRFIVIVLGKMAQQKPPTHYPKNTSKGIHSLPSSQMRSHIEFTILRRPQERLPALSSSTRALRPTNAAWLLRKKHELSA